MTDEEIYLRAWKGGVEDAANGQPIIEPKVDAYKEGWHFFHNNDVAKIMAQRIEDVDKRAAAMERQYYDLVKPEATLAERIVVSVLKDLRGRKGFCHTIEDIEMTGIMEAEVLPDLTRAVQTQLDQTVFQFVKDQGDFQSRIAVALEKMVDLLIK